MSSKKPPLTYGRKHCTLFVEEFDEQITILPKHALRIYGKLLKYAVHHNYALMTTKELADLTGYNEKRVLNALRILRERHLVTKSAQSIHLLSDDCVWYGKLRQYLGLDKNESNRDEWFEEYSVTDGKKKISHRRFNYEADPKQLKRVLEKKKRKYKPKNGERHYG